MTITAAAPSVGGLSHVARAARDVGAARTQHQRHTACHLARHHRDEALALVRVELLDFARHARENDRIDAAIERVIDHARERCDVGRAVGVERRRQHRAYAGDGATWRKSRDGIE